MVLIPDVWGGCSNEINNQWYELDIGVLIPDVWGGCSNACD